MAVIDKIKANAYYKAKDGYVYFVDCIFKCGLVQVILYSNKGVFNGSSIIGLETLSREIEQRVVPREHWSKTLPGSGSGKSD